jgi:hypothetical protein
LRGERKLEVVVLFTTPPATLFALRSAANLADRLSARIRLVVPHVVPYPLPLDEPAVHPRVLSSRLCAMAHQAGVECAIDIRLCRERWDAVEQALPARALVVIGRRPPWWRFQEWKLGRRLLQDGHQVAYAEERNSCA